MRLAPLACLVAMGSVAQAEGPPYGHPNGYAAAGAITGTDQHDFNGAAVEVGHRIAASSLFARVMGHAGSNEGGGRGTYKQGRAGVEARTCSPTGMVCGSFGVDVGLHRGVFTPFVPPTSSGVARAIIDSPDDRRDATVVAPRLTIDGGGQVRVRGMIELPQHYHAGGRTSGVALSLTLGIGWH
jgi:hypothetical protein